MESSGREALDAQEEPETAEGQSEGEHWRPYPEWQDRLDQLLATGCARQNAQKVNKLLTMADRLVMECVSHEKPQHFPRLERVLTILTSEDRTNLDIANKLLIHIDADLHHESVRANQNAVVALVGLILSPVILAVFFAGLAWLLDTVNFTTDLVRYTLYDPDGQPILSKPLIVPSDLPPPIPPDVFANADQAVVEVLPPSVLGFNRDLLLTCGLLGVLGSIVSMIVRLGELNVGDKIGHREIFITSIFRPLIGFCFAVLMLVAVQAGFLPFDIQKLVLLQGLDELITMGADQSDVRTQASLLFLLCFLAGFSERMGRDLINRATANLSDDGRNNPCCRYDEEAGAFVKLDQDRSDRRTDVGFEGKNKDAKGA